MSIKLLRPEIAKIVNSYEAVREGFQNLKTKISTLPRAIKYFAQFRAASK